MNKIHTKNSEGKEHTISLLMAKIEQKSTVHFLLILLLFFLVIGAFFAVFAIRGYTASLLPARVMSVQASGKAIAEPDVANLSFSVISEGESPKQLQDENNQTMNSVIAFVKSRGVEDADIKTTAYNLFPTYEYDETRRQTFISGYRLQQTVAVKIRDFDETAKIVGGLTELGINQIDAIRFSVEDQEGYLAKAREEAFAKAHEKATRIAAANHVRLGDIVSINESTSQPPIAYPFEEFGRGGSTATVLPDIQKGSEEITVTVSVSFEIRN